MANDPHVRRVYQVQNRLRLRSAVESDEELLFAWRNEREARESSRNTGLIGRKEHRDWLNKSLHGDFSGRILRIAELDGTPVGVVRADPHDDGSCEISYTVAPNFRGRGIAKAMTQRFVTEHLRDKTLVAVIKQGAVASEKVARALGMSPHAAVSPDDPSDARIFIEWHT